MEIQVLLFWVLTPCDDVVKLTLKTEEARSSDTLLPHRKTWILWTLLAGFLHVSDNFFFRADNMHFRKFVT